jgi:class 3 adenylate cyclase
MDVQMPEMDGFEASREINRRWAAAARPRIVAMMANAMQGDRELCLAAGMDDYVSKPVRVEELVAALERSSGREPARVLPIGDGIAERAAAPEEDPVIDPRVLERQRAAVGPDFLRELLATFLEDSQELVGTMRRALGGEDIDVFRRAAHSLKSNAASFGATRLAAIARELETLARSGSLDGAPSKLDRLAGEYEQVARALIGSQGGIVNQMLGDGLMALFGAPLPRVDHRERAVRAGLEMLELVAGFDREQESRGKPAIRIGVGIASGQVIAGYTGTERRVTYTCVGDTVNLAAHLEAHTKVVGRPLLIDEHTLAGLSGTVRTEDHGSVQFKSRVQPVRVYSVAPDS